MNKNKRRQLQDAIDLLESAKNGIIDARIIVEEVRDQEEEDFDNMPECRQESEAGQNMQENVDELGGVYDELDVMEYTIDEQVEAIQNVIDK